MPIRIRTASSLVVDLDTKPLYYESTEDEKGSLACQAEPGSYSLFMAWQEII
jgi:hypothetical protein